MLTIDSSQIIFDKVAFDTEHFGFPCAILNLQAGQTATAADLESVCARAREQGIKFLTVTSPVAIAGIEKNSQGTLFEYDAIISEVESVISHFPQRFTVEPFSEKNWNDVLFLAQFRSSNRFSTDQNFSESAVFAHKVDLFKLQWQRHPHLAFIAFSSTGEPLGFHLCIGQADTLNHYDLVVRPEFRTGAVALQLISAVLNSAKALDNNPTKATTKIYGDNEPSHKLFTKLGFKRNGKEFHYYHFWL